MCQNVGICHFWTVWYLVLILYWVMIILSRLGRFRSRFECTYRDKHWITDDVSELTSCRIDCKIRPQPWERYVVFRHSTWLSCSKVYNYVGCIIRQFSVSRRVLLEQVIRLSCQLRSRTDFLKDHLEFVLWVISERLDDWSSSYRWSRYKWSCCVFEELFSQFILHFGSERIIL